MKRLKWITVQKKVNDLVPQEINPRTITDKQMSDLKKSLKRYNLAEIPAIGLDDKILAGNQRIKALQLLGRGNEIIDVRIPNRSLTKEESEQYLISSNALGGSWDFESLKTFDLDFLINCGFEQIDLSKFWDENNKTKTDSFDINHELKKITKPKTQLGDIIILGRHKIICADATKPENLKRLFGKEKASIIYSDPVYNLNIDYDGGIGGNREFGGNVNDSRTFEEYKTFIRESLSSALSVSYPDVHVFYYCDQIYIGVIQDIYRSLDITNKRVCIWLKNNQSPVPKVAFNKVYEPCVYGSMGKPYLAESITNLNEVMNKEFSTGNNLHSEFKEFIDVWASKRLSAKDYEHATSKPIDLHEKAIKRCSKHGDIILDSFLGSGSTLLAGEQLGRKVYGCELEPRFCDLIIKRFETLTGIKAVIETYEKK
jgi:DNA modification methylase